MAPAVAISLLSIVFPVMKLLAACDGMDGQIPRWFWTVSKWSMFTWPLSNW